MVARLTSNQKAAGSSPASGKDLLLLLILVIAVLRDDVTGLASLGICADAQSA